MRYAIYFTPAREHSLTRAAARWLGYDAYTGETLAQPEVMGLDSARFSALTAEPKRYGFHATLKAPFELREGLSEVALIDALDEFAAQKLSFEIPGLVLGRLGDFFALVPGAWNPELQLLANDCVSRLDSFRAPLSPADVARRDPDSLTQSQRQNLTDWGYPYVMDDFRFHMTLTGRVPAADQPVLRSAIESEFAAHIGQPLAIDRLALFVEPARGQPFTVRHIALLRAPENRKT